MEEVKDKSNLSVEDRKKYRIVLLRGIYTHYFENNGASLSFSYDEVQENNEKRLALKYLIDKGLLVKEAQGRTSLYQPTVYGIDLIENIESK